MRNSVSNIKHRKKLSALHLAPYLFIMPAIIYIFCVTIIPILMALPISFTDWSAYTPERSFIGLENYKRLFADVDFLKSLGVTAQFLLYVPLVMITGLGIACLLNASIKGIKFFRVVFYAPVITSTVAAAVLFEWFYQPAFGLFNNILRTIGLQGIGWVTDASTAVLSVMIFKIWKGFGVAMLIYLAGLQDVPGEVREAASIDGASGWQAFKYITFPLLRPAHIYLLITNVITVFMIFQETYMFKGPLASTDTVVNYIYEKGFSGEMGYACAMSFILFLIVLVFTLIQKKATKMDLM
ncbi:MAG: sugar ABC transporter permease [Oscillospiraceae bacterium]